jgi:methyltransferase (TIGR00027 family)
MWLANLQMQYLAPSAGPVRVSAQISPERWRVVRQTYARGRAIVLEVEIAFEVEGQAVARGSCRYFLKKAANLAPYELDAQPNPIFALRSKASARLIAGLRAQETAQPHPRVCDPWASALAGPHGEFLARRFSAILPPLRDMVVARTLDVDRLVCERVSEGVEQLVLVGAGLDARPFRLFGRPDSGDQADPLARVRVFELDLPHMLAERQRLVEGLDLPAVSRTAVPFDLRLTTLRDALEGAGFRRDAPAVFVIEGVSMYQDCATMTALLAELRELLAPAGSVAWMDVVRAAVLTGTGIAAVDGFITGMQRLGEPFSFGVEDPESWIVEHGLRGRAVTVADAADPIFGFYAFLHLSV